MTGNRKEHFVDRAKKGTRTDVHFLMDHLRMDQDMATIKLVDLSLDHVANEEGVQVIRHFLFNGTTIQKNYSATHFRRKGNRQVILEAWEAGAIDHIQAFAR
jgi:helix-turn-helix protein